MENRFLGNIAATSFKNLFPNSISKKQKMKNSVRTRNKSNAENIAPIDSNISDPPLLPSNSLPKKSPSKPSVVHKEIVLKSESKSDAPVHPDPPVKVMVRIRPSTAPASLDWTVKKVSNDSLSVGDKIFNFHSVLDSNSSQEDVFKQVGVPLVNDALAGYNTSILAYGQTGSGKSYTMWGPPSAMVEDDNSHGFQGLVPRIFQMLFSKIQQDQENADGRQFNYQCRCSFLEIYNEQIGDLLDPTKRNLEIREEPKNGFYVDNLSEEYVTNYEDVTQILIKGLSSRKVGATSTNSKSSRSHIVFTCVIESWCKETSSKCFGSSKSSRISLVDLAGFERSILDDAGKQCVKEGKFIKKSTSQLGYLVNCLVEKSRSGVPEALPYQGSCLTHLLRESLGGNAKLSVICSITPDKKYGGETVSTLRFGQRVKYVQNEPVINEITEDDVDGLTDQIRQLKEELIRAKTDQAWDSIGSNHGHFKGRNVRESLNQLRLSLNRSLILPYVDNDDPEEVCADENDIKELRTQIDMLQSSPEEDSMDIAEGCETDLTSEQYVSCSDEGESEIDEINSEETDPQISEELPPVDEPEGLCSGDKDQIKSSISIPAVPQFDVLQGPTISESPKIKNMQRKSLIASSNSLCFHDTAPDNSGNSKSLRQSVRSSNHIRSSLRSSRVIPGPTESLAASLHRGLEIIDYHQRNSPLDRSSVSFSFEHLALKPCLKDDKANASAQTLTEDGLSTSFMCKNCKQRGDLSSTEWMDRGKDSAMATEREKELETVCKEHEAKIDQLNQQLMKYKLELEQTKGSSGNDSDHDVMKNESENKLLMWNGNEGHDLELIKEKCEVKEIQGEFDDQSHNVQSFDADEKEALLKEIESLRSKLQSQTDINAIKSTDRIRSSLLAQSIQLRKSGTLPRLNTEEDIEKERERWMEMESEWICLTDDLRIDLESLRQRAEKVEMELRLEKKCTEELDDALKRSVLGHARMVEHYAELQENYNDLVAKHRSVMGGVAEIKRAAAKAGAKGHGSRFARCLAAELSALRVQRDRERELLKKENIKLRTQLRDTAEAVHAAGELLVRLREAEETASVSEGNMTRVQEENESLKKQIEKLKRKHKMEMATMKQYLAESRLPEAALRPLSREESYTGGNDYTSSFVPEDDDQAWRAEFGPIYQEHF
ncbi:OLC1v1022581C1 [Oldenlandia corymbosa var. corymbosa]|uniref:OLC1v1022581C1 n=1 Tax=Oldenlandia corymbosa var. corymbosa TaxID=529605 RepID=A0AAV1C0I5_OLDCO|nr:OLC1v1022581C1 [Oldenlandia corymbosa var. corymbosa]